SGWYSARLLERDAAAELASLRPHLDLLKAVASPVLVFAEVSGAIHGDFRSPLSARPLLKASQWREFGRRLTRLAAWTAAERARAGDWSFLRAVLEGVFTVPGDGSVDFDEVLSELRDYSGWVVLEAEQDPKKADPMTYASLGFGNLRRLVTERRL